MNNIKENIRKYLDPLKVILVILGVAASYFNQKNAINYLLYFVALPLNLIPVVDLYILHEKTGDSDKDTHTNQLANHHLTNTIVLLIAIFLPVHGTIKKILILITLIYLTLEAIRHLVHSFFHKHPTKKGSHFLKFLIKGGFILLLIPVVLYMIL